ncbi:MAG: GTP-binding protein [Cellvibrionaceae bacterium]|jgi:GTP-binding protein
MLKGKKTVYSLLNLQSCCHLFLAHAVDVYESQVIGIHARVNDLAVKPVKGKRLTNIRASGTD